jgi:hypothetical protein
VVNQQVQFSKAHETLSQHFALMRNVSLVNGQGLPELDFRNMPDRPITFEANVNIVGLELVDIYLWVKKDSWWGEKSHRNCCLLSSIYFIEAKLMSSQSALLLVVESNCLMIHLSQLKKIG